MDIVYCYIIGVKDTLRHLNKHVSSGLRRQ